MCGSINSVDIAFQVLHHMDSELNCYYFTLDIRLLQKPSTPNMKSSFTLKQAVDLNRAMHTTQAAEAREAILQQRRAILPLLTVLRML